MTNKDFFAALDALEKDHDYLTAGGVFPEHLIQNFIKQKQTNISPQQNDFLTTPQSRSAFEKELRELYENATWNEINKAIDWGMETMEKPYNKDLFLKKIRIKLED